MIIVDFKAEHVEEAMKLAWENYQEERGFVPELPEDVKQPKLGYFAANELGVAAVDDKGNLLGFLGVYEPWEGAFDTFDSLGTFSPIHAHGAVKENRARIYQDMYAYAAEKWIKQDIIGVGIALYAHDGEAKKGLFEYGFGMRCKDAVNYIDKIDVASEGNLIFDELEVKSFPEVRHMRIELNSHLKNSPCFMQSTSEERDSWLRNVEAGNRRTFVAKKNNTIVAYLDVAESGENFATDYPRMLNLQGAYCLPEYRGLNITDQLLGYVARTLAEEGISHLGVDYESYNPTANRFWAKYFKEYTNSVVRKVETWSRGK